MIVNVPREGCPQVDTGERSHQETDDQWRSYKLQWLKLERLWKQQLSSGFFTSHSFMEEWQREATVENVIWHLSCSLPEGMRKTLKPDGRVVSGLMRPKLSFWLSNWMPCLVLANCCASSEAHHSDHEACCAVGKFSEINAAKHW